MKPSVIQYTYLQGSTALRLLLAPHDLAIIVPPRRSDVGEGAHLWLNSMSSGSNCLTQLWFLTE